MISVDNAGGIDKAIEHLVGHGHRQIAFIAGAPDDKGDSQARLAAYHAALKEHSLEGHRELIAYGAHTFSGGYEAA